MPTIRANGIDLYYELHPARQASPDPTPIVLVMGLAFNSLSWKRLLPWLTARRDVIVFDNRGTGRSAPLKERLTIRQMADDTAELIAGLGLRRAHVFGFSMGSMIAQEVALNHPERVKGLILGAGTPGGLYHWTVNPTTLYTMAVRLTMRGPRSAEAVIPILYSRDFARRHPEIVRDDMATRLIYPTSPEVYRRQLQAIARHNTYNRLGQLAVPTLLVTGDQDLMVRPENSVAMNRRIRRSELVVLPGGGHNLPSEQPSRLAEVVLDFLDRHYAQPVEARAS